MGLTAQGGLLEGAVIRGQADGEVVLSPPAQPAAPGLPQARAVMPQG